MLSELSSIDPGLTVRTDRAVRRALRVCEAPDRFEGDMAKVIDYARQEFDGGHAAVDTAKARRIVAVIQSSGFCREPGNS
jgi:hypothetical protein